MSGDEVRQKIKESGVPLAEVARLLDITPQTLNSRLKATDVGISSIRQIAKAVNKNLYEFLGDIPPSSPANPNKGLEIVTVDTSENSVATIFDIKAAAGTPTILDEPDYYKHLDTFTFPNHIFRGSLVSLQVRGDSMHPTIKQGDFVIGRQAEHLTDLRNSEVYIIVYQQDLRVHFTVKRCYHFAGDDLLTTQADNSNYPSGTIAINSILKLYHVQGCLTTQLQRIESSMKGQLERIERRIDRIEERIQN